MPFIKVGRFNLTDKWQFTPEITGELIKIETVDYVFANEEYLKAAVALAFKTEDETNTLFRQLLSYRNEKDLFEFSIPRGVENWSIGLKRLDKSSVAWLVDVYVFEGYIVEENIAEKITTRVIEAMSNIYSRGNEANLKPESGEKSLDAGVVRTLIQSNDDRAYLTIRVENEGVILFADKDEQGNGVNVIEELAPGEVYSLPIADGIYHGNIYALSENSTTISFTEFTK